MKAKLILCALAALFTQGCTQIYFDNGTVSDVQNTQKSRSWHHNWAIDLYESTDPVNLQARCRNGQWQSVKTEKTFLNGLAGSAANQVLPIWYPKTVTVECVTFPLEIHVPTENPTRIQTEIQQ